MGIYVFIKEWTPLLLYLGAIVAAITALAGRVSLSLMYLLPLYPLQNIYEKLFDFPLGNKISTLLIIAMLVGWMTSKNSTKEPFFIPSPFNVLLLFYMLFICLSLWRGSHFLGTLLSDNSINERLQTWKGYLLLQILFFIVANNVRTKVQIIQIFITICVTMVLMNFFDLRQVGEMTSWVSRMKFRGTLNIGANEVAAFYATYTFILLGLWIFKPKEIKFRPWLMALIACNFFLVLFLFSRGAYAAVLMSLVFVALNRKPLLIVALVFVVLFWQLILPDEIVKRLTFTETEGTLDQSAALRLVYWEMTFNYFLENPIFGIGFNVIQHLIGHDTHNIWLRTLAEQGLLGAFFLVTIFMCAFRQGWFLYRHSRDNFFRGLGFGFCCCVLSMIVGNIFGDRWIHVQLNAFFWVFLGMVERGNFLLPLDEKNYRREGLHRESSRPIRKDWPTEDQVEMK